MDSCGLAELVRARNRVPHIVLRGAQPQVLRLIEVAHLAGVFEHVEAELV
jgi:anti-anti-sigma regulatory factor